MRARTADDEGDVEVDGVRVHYEVYGDGPLTLLLLPTWTVVNARFWKFQVPFLARHYRVVSYDGPGNGRSDRPTDPAAYSQAAETAYALAVLDATRTDRALVVALSKAANWALDLAANHGGRVLGTVLIGPSVALTPLGPERAAFMRVGGPAPELPPSRVPEVEADPAPHWAKYNRDYWRSEYDDFLWFFFGQCFSEPRSTKAIEDCVGWGRETSGEVLVADNLAGVPDRATLTDWCARITAPVLCIHGDDDHTAPLSRSRAITELTGGRLLVIHGGGHIPLARDPVVVNLAIEEFANELAARVRPAEASVALGTREWSRGRHRPRRVLYISSPIGLGHAQRDVAIAAELRALHPDVQIDWLAQDPVTRVLDLAGERLHPASRFLASESGHIESEAGEHDLHCFEALRRMDEVLLANFMVFHEVVRDGDYDVVIGDEAWDVDHFLHENPELKRCAYVWMTDFVGYLPMPDGGRREQLVAADYNAEMIEHIERFPRLRDRAIFVGGPDDIVADRFGPGLPAIREWTQQHYDFAGYVTGGADPGLADRAALRRELGYRPDEKVCIVTVGGSGVGGHLLRRVVDAADEARRRVDGLRMVVVTGPRIDASALPRPRGVELRAFVPQLYRHLAACDLAVVQGGLTTCMELTAAGTPFVYVPLRHHFEQNFHVAHRLERYGAGVRLDYDALTPETLAGAIAAGIGHETAYRPVETDGARRAAGLVGELL
jgi:pimeloyl-ACP methyl ester carboxylesterase/predicted glycosyltransferase